MKELEKRMQEELFDVEVQYCDSGIVYMIACNLTIPVMR